MKHPTRARAAAAISCTAAAVVGWFLVIRHSQSLTFVLTVIASFAAVGFLAVALLPRFSPYRVFAIATAALTVIVSLIGVWDMMTDTSSFFPGLFGLILLMVALPTGGILLLADALLVLRLKWQQFRKNKQDSSK